MASELKKRIGIFMIILIAAVACSIPTVFREQFKEIGWITRPIALGLDLSGGVQLVYEVQFREAVKSNLVVTSNSIRASLREAKIPTGRIVVLDNYTIEVPLITDSRIEDAKNRVESEFKGLVFQRQVVEEGRTKLVFGMLPGQAESIERESINQAIEVLRNRVDQFGVSEPIIQRVGTDRIMLQMPGVSDVQSVKRVVGSVAKLEFRLLPLSGSSTSSVTLKDRQGNPVKVEDQPLMTGDAVKDARAAFTDREIEVSLQLTNEGGKTFARLTSDNVGRNVAIILDGIVYSSPVIREAIRGGQASISGGFNLEEAKQLAVVLRSGALPAPLKVLEERTVGPSLGAESINKGIVSILIGFAMIIVFMALYYGKSGWVAIGTLALNLILMVACLSLFHATLTLPGLAGLALTIGMAVDSNVIIFERIRDEIRVGASRDAAVTAGFDKALSAILDSNLTTLLSGLILMYFGSGPIRGFAVTLSVGIATTIYCATFATRLGFDCFRLHGKKEGELSI